MKKKKLKKFDKWFLLTWRKVWIIVVGWFLAIVLHNLFYALSEITGKNLAIGEVFFFFLASILIPLYFMMCLVYTLIKMIKDKTLFEVKFVIKFLIAIILGAIATLLVIKFNFINPEMGFMLAGIFIIFTLVFYSLIKLIKKKNG